MHRKYNKFLIVSLVAVLIFGVYSYFYKNLKSEAAAGDSALTSSLNTTGSPSTSTTSSSTFSEDSAFLVKLNSLKNIKIDVSIFESQAFKLLVSNNIKLDPVPYGRVNPFSPIDKPTLTNNKVTYTLKTNPASAITNKSAVLNGSLEGATSNNMYFEYGLAEPLDRVTPKLTPSSIGSFATGINSLASKTTYLYRAVANVNGSLVYGDIISFNTN